MTTNILDIYDRLYEVSESIKGESADYIRGATDMVYLFKIALQKYQHINLHIENRRLKRKLLITDVNFDDSLFTILELRKEVKELMSLVKEQEKVSAIITDKLTQVNLEIEGLQIDFYSDIDQQSFNIHLPEIGNYVYNRLHKGRRNGKPRHMADYKVWLMQYLRDRGFTCVP